MSEKKKTGPKGPRAGPLSPNEFEEFKKLCQIQCTLAELSFFFECSKDTLKKRVEEHYGRRFNDVFEENRGYGKASLRRAQYSKALGGNTTMLIWLGKQYLGQVENPINEGEHHIVFQSRIGPTGQLIQEMKTAEDWEKSRTFDASEFLKKESEQEKPSKKKVSKKKVTKKAKKK